MRARIFLMAVLAMGMIVMTGGAEAQDIRLIVRGDDLGMTQGSLAAFEQAFNEGILTCASVVVPAPWFEAAAGLVRNHPRWCVGIHLTLIGEWKGYRWRPVLPWNTVRSIVDGEGFFYRSPDELLARGPRMEDIEAEWRGQIDLALRKGIQPQYLDFHYMGPESHPGLGDVVNRIAGDYGLPVSGAMGEKPLPGVYRAPIGQKTDLAVKTLENLAPGLWLWVFHPGIDSPEHNALVHSKPEHVFRDGNVGKHRAAETEALKSPRVRKVIEDRAIRLTTYETIRDELRKQDRKN